MIHLIMVLFTVVSFLLFGSFRFKKMEKMGKEEREEYALSSVQGVLRKVLRVAGVTVEIEGLENIPEKEAVLYIGNHRSFFDVVIAYTLVKGSTGFIAKEELKKVPLLERWMNELGCLFLDRGNVKQNLKVILTAIKNVKNGGSIWIYPEGTRSQGKDETELLEFKDGSFKIAEKSGCKIVPVAMIHTREILEAHFPWIKPTVVKVKIGEAYRMQDLTEEQRVNIGAYSRNLIKDYIVELKEKEHLTGEE